MLKPKKKFDRELPKCWHWCIHCSCSIRDHSLAEYDKDLMRYTIVCKCGKCPGYARDPERKAETVGG